MFSVVGAVVSGVSEQASPGATGHSAFFSFDEWFDRIGCNADEKPSHLCGDVWFGGRKLSPGHGREIEIRAIAGDVQVKLCRQDHNELGRETWLAVGETDSEVDWFPLRGDHGLRGAGGFVFISVVRAYDGRL